MILDEKLYLTSGNEQFVVVLVYKDLKLMFANAWRELLRRFSK